MARRKWKFYIETDNGSGYLDPDGTLRKEKEFTPNFIGFENEADKEADSRAEAYENLTGRTCTRIVYESQGKVEPKTNPRLKM